MRLAGDDEFYGPPAFLANDAGSGSGIDWGNVLQTVVKGATAVYQAKSQADIAKAQSQAGAVFPSSFGLPAAIPNGGFSPSIFPQTQYPTQLRVPSQMPSNDSWLWVGVGALAIVGILIITSR